MIHKLAQRRSLPHTPPAWVSAGAVYFITINGRPRGENQFCKDGVADEIFKAADFYNDVMKWYMSLLVLMPDHLHAIVSFPRNQGMKRRVAAWKGYVARSLGVNWQRDFFDHRLRGDESFEEKAKYIRANPVRAGFVADLEEWPYVWKPTGG